MNPGLSTLSELLRRRQEIMGPLWDIEEASLMPDNPGLLRAAASAVAELRQLVQDWRACAAEASGELGKTLRYFGDALFILSARKDPTVLAEALRAHRCGEALLRDSNDCLEHANILFNLAGTLRCTSDGWDRPVMEEARRLYAEANQIFAREKPERRALVEPMLRDLDAQLRMLSIYEAAGQGQGQTTRLIEALEQATPNDAEIPHQVSPALESLKNSAVNPTSLSERLRSESQAAQEPLCSNHSGDGEQRIRLTTPGLPLHERIAENDALFGEVFGILEVDASKGEFTPQRRDALHASLVDFQRLVNEMASTRGESTVERIAAAPSAIKHILVQPKARTGRARELEHFLAAIRSSLLNQLADSTLGPTERDCASDLYNESSRLRADLVRYENDEGAILELEHDQLRSFAHRQRQFGLRHHLMLVDPLWGWARVRANPNAVFFAGSNEVGSRLRDICERRGLQLAPAGMSWGAGEAQWHRLRECAIGVFDLSPATVSERAAVCYALGTALTLGIVPVVVVRAGTELPFDVDKKPISLDALERGLDDAVFAICPIAGTPSIEATARRVLARISRQKTRGASALLNRLAEPRRLDPSFEKDALGRLIDAAAPGKSALVLPMWPAFYPDLGTPNCFHITPFSQPWSSAARQELAQACSDLAVAYQPTDEADESRLIHAIWEGVCRATHVIVDLTGLNANVCLELGIAHTLGRPTLLVSRDEPAQGQWFPEISRLRVHRYEATGGRSLANIARAFLSP